MLVGTCANTLLGPVQDRSAKPAPLRNNLTQLKIDCPRVRELGSDAYQAVRGALQTRLAALDAQEALARSTDADDVALNVQ